MSRSYLSKYMMKNGAILFLSIGIFMVWTDSGLGETIYTKDGRTIDTKIINRVKGTIWSEVVSGNSTGKVGIQIDSIEKVLNDDGTVSEYSPTYIAEQKAMVERERVIAEKKAEESEYLMEKFFGDAKESATHTEGAYQQTAVPDTVVSGQKDEVPTTEMPRQNKAKSVKRTRPTERRQPKEAEAASATATVMPTPGANTLSKDIAQKNLPKAMGLFSGAMAGFIIFILILILAIYVYFSICLQTIALKTNTPQAWLAWIPLANIFLMISIAKRPKMWLYIAAGILVLCFLPVIKMLGSLGLLVLSVILWCDIAKLRNKPMWLGILMIVPIANLIIPGYLAFSD